MKNSDISRQRLGYVDMDKLKKNIITICRRAAWAPLAVLIGHFVFAELFGHEPYVDPVMHFSGGLAAAFFFHIATREGKNIFGQLTKLGSDSMSFGLTCAVAVFWEFGEFCSDAFLGTNVQENNVNTMSDLVLGVAGAVFFIVVNHIWRREKYVSA